VEKEKIFEILKQMISKKMYVDKDILTENTTFEELEIDGFNLLNIMIYMEDEFNIEVFDDKEDLDDDWVTLGDIVKYIAKRLKAKNYCK